MSELSRTVRERTFGIDNQCDVWSDVTLTHEEPFSLPSPPFYLKQTDHRVKSMDTIDELEVELRKELRVFAEKWVERAGLDMVIDALDTKVMLLEERSCSIAGLPAIFPNQSEHLH